MNQSLKALLGLVLLSVILIPIRRAAAAEFSPGSPSELQDNLNEAATNDQNDTIHLAAITYRTSVNGAAFSYLPDAGENFSLTILGATEGTSTIAGDIDTANCFMASNGAVANPDDANADVTIRGISFQTPAQIECLEHLTNKADFIVEGNNFTVGFTAAHFESNAGGSFTFNSNRMEGGFCPTSAPTSACFMATANLFANGNVTMENNFAQGFGGGSLLFEHIGTTGSLKLIGNTLMNLSPVAPPMAFVTQNATVEVSGNNFHSNSLNAPVLAFYVGNSEADVTNNILTDNFSGTAPVFATATAMGTFNITNNTMAANGGSRTLFEWAPTTDMAVLNFYNNIIFGSFLPLIGNIDIYLDDNIGATGPMVNIANSNFDSFLSDCETEPGCAEDITMSDNLIGEDPLLANPRAGDVNLRPGSPVIGKGNPDAPALPTLDFAGNPLNNPPDMGALAFVPDAGEDDGAGAETEVGPGGCVLAQAVPTAGSLAFLLIPMLLMGLRLFRKS